MRSWGMTNTPRTMQGGTPATHEEPPPTSSPSSVPVWPLVVSDLEHWLPEEGRADLAADMLARDAEGRRKYGTPLTTANGRRPLVAYQESLDQVVYLRQALTERGVGERIRARVDDVETHAIASAYIDALHLCARLRRLAVPA